MNRRMLEDWTPGAPFEADRARALELVRAGSVPEEERPFIQRVAALVQAVALSRLVETGTTEARAWAHDAFLLRRSLADKAAVDALETMAIGMVAGCHDEACDYLRSRPEPPLRDGAPWDERILDVICRAWWALEAAGDPKRALIATSALYAEQPRYEKGWLDAMREAGRERPALMRLACLYHWAQATHDIATYRLTGMPHPVAEKVDMHFEQAFRTADLDLANLIGWLRAAAPYERPTP